MNLEAINTALIAVGPVVLIGGGWKVACWFVGLGEIPAAPAAPKKRPAPAGAIRARATVARPLPTVVEGEILPPAGPRKELTR